MGHSMRLQWLSTIIWIIALHAASILDNPMDALTPWWRDAHNLQSMIYAGTAVSSFISVAFIMYASTQIPEPRKKQMKPE